MNSIIKFITLLTSILLVSGEISYGYSKREQHTWVQNYESCGGKLQSPVPISSFKSIALPLPALELIGYHDFLSSSVYLKNTGHTVSMSLKNGSKSSHLPYVHGGALDPNQKYELDHIHFHWGSKNNRGSEHELNGIRYPMEMHIVHRNSNYENFTEALNYEDGLLVLAIFFQLQDEDNKLLYPIVNNLVDIKWINNEKKMETPITLASLLPHNTDVFYTYKGSLTSPPCSEVVTWVVFPTIVPISLSQLNKFRLLSDGEDILADNFRRLQHIGMRKVYVRKLNSYLFAKYNGTIYDVMNLDWFWH